MRCIGFAKPNTPTRPTPLGGSRSIQLSYRGGSGDCLADGSADEGRPPAPAIRSWHQATANSAVSISRLPVRGVMGASSDLDSTCQWSEQPNPGQPRVTSTEV